jgi:hypothetical protein
MAKRTMKRCAMARKCPVQKCAMAHLCSLSRQANRIQKSWLAFQELTSIEVLYKLSSTFYGYVVNFKEECPFCLSGTFDLPFLVVKVRGYYWFYS